LPYPPHKQLQSTMLFIHPSKRGHFYFVKKGTFLLWLDRETGEIFMALIKSLEDNPDLAARSNN
jgi:hypothetical protein